MKILVLSLSFMVTLVACCRVCAEEPQGTVQASCGGIRGERCAEGLVCIYPEGSCGAADRSGTCVRPPEMCTKEFRPICGCDEHTYPNACGAKSKGVSVRAKGECGGDGKLKELK